MIGIDWGTTALRAWRFGPGGSVVEARAAPLGIMKVGDRGFAAVLREVAGDWLAAGERRVLLSGMIGSRQGWVEAPYLPCPAGVDEIAARLTPVEFAGAEVLVVPGLVGGDAEGVPDIMRGEETQVLGVAAQEAVVCLPGTHSKWVDVVGGRIERFATYMTGEVFAALADHTILTRTVTRGPVDPAAFDDGVVQAAGPGGFLHHVFGVRTKVLRNRLSMAAAYGYLSGLVIGEELNSAMRERERPVIVVGAAELTALYARAITARGGTVVEAGEAVGAAGLALLGERVAWN